MSNATILQKRFYAYGILVSWIGDDRDKSGSASMADDLPRRGEPPVRADIVAKLFLHW
jgi:hypothetical protein